MKILSFISRIFIWFSVICTITSCNDYVNSDKRLETENSENLLHYASFIEVFNYKSGYYVNVTNPWGNVSLGEFYLYPDSLRLPEELEKHQVIRTPINSVVTYSSTQWSVFLQLNEIQRVKGILESNYTQNQEIKTLISEGKISDVGYENHINIEKVIDIKPDVILYTPYSTTPRTEIGELTGAVMFPFADYLENHPLGRTEWLKVIGFLTCRERDTDRWFDSIATNYESIKSLCDSVKCRPSVFSDLPYEGQWYVPGGKSYIAQIFKDAGADYVWSENNSTASQPVDAETVLSQAGDASYWRIMNSTDLPYSYERLSVENELYTYFKAFREKHVIVCDVMKTSYFEKSQYQPDVLLKDFVKIFHPDLLDDDYEPQFYYLLND